MFGETINFTLTKEKTKVTSLLGGVSTLMFVGMILSYSSSEVY